MISLKTYPKNPNLFVLCATASPPHTKQKSFSDRCLLIEPGEQPAALWFSEEMELEFHDG
jgi:hypothetical protein